MIFINDVFVTDVTITIYMNEIAFKLGFTEQGILNKKR